MNGDTDNGRTPGFMLRPLPVALRAANRLGDRFANQRPCLTPEALTRAAARRAGLAPRFSTGVETGLEVLCRSLRDETQLHWFGRMNQWNLTVTGLAELLKLEELFRRHPELDNTPLNAPVIVTGLPRSGTTFLHRLLSTADDALPIQFYRHLFPNQRRPDSRLLEANILFEPWRWAAGRYQMDAIHFVRPKLADECNFGMRLDIHSCIFWSIAPTYSYLHWLLDQDMQESYQLYRRVLILHQRQAPGKRLTLKCPHHLAWLPALHAAIPEAQIIQTHRNPLEVVPSECNLILSLHGVGSRSLNWRKTVEHNLHKVHTYAERSIDYAETKGGQHMLHLDYRRLVAEPVILAREIHQHFKIGWGDTQERTLRHFFQNNQQHKHGKVHYSLAQFDLKAEEINDSFHRYRERFLDIESSH